VEPTAVSLLAFGLMFSAALLGIQLRRILPEEHFKEDTKDTVKVAIGLVATMTALILGLVTASAKSGFDAVDTAVRHTAADVLSLDRTLARYGPESSSIRGALQRSVGQQLAAIWPPSSSLAGRPDVQDVTGTEELAGRIRDLSPQNEEQRWLQARALEQSESLLETRWAVFSSIGTSVLVPFLAVLVSWLAIAFASFGLFAPRNATVIAALFVCSVSVAGAIFLILEMDDPFHGVIKISPDPLRYAYSRISQ
jgi:hypothetical protein